MKTQNKRQIRPLLADGGLYTHHVGVAPYQDENGSIHETYQALNQDGKAVAFISMMDGECINQDVMDCPTILHQIALQSWAAQIGEDYENRELAYGEECLAEDEKIMEQITR